MGPVEALLAYNEERRDIKRTGPTAQKSRGRILIQKPRVSPKFNAREKRPAAPHAKTEAVTDKGKIENRKYREGGEPQFRFMNPTQTRNEGEKKKG